MMGYAMNTSYESDQCVVYLENPTPTVCKWKSRVVLLVNFVLPKKGRCNKEEKAWQASEKYGEARRQHSSVEVCININRPICIRSVFFVKTILYGEIDPSCAKTFGMINNLEV